VKRRKALKKGRLPAAALKFVARTRAQLGVTRRVVPLAMVGGVSVDQELQHPAGGSALSPLGKVK
jgi:hypothetical protein